MTLAPEIARHAPLQRAREFFDIRVLDRGRRMKSWRERGRRAAVRAVAHQRLKVQIEIERASELLSEENSATSRASVSLPTRLALEKACTLRTKLRRSAQQSFGRISASGLRRQTVATVGNRAVQEAR